VSGKIFTLYEDQIRILTSRGLSIPDHQKAIEILSRENYYRLINGYKDLFLKTTTPSETYIKGASLSEIHALYRFDEELRIQFLRVFLMIENYIKAFIAYEFAKVHGACDYLDATNFNYLPPYQRGINKLISKIQRIIHDKSPYDNRLQHYQNNHEGAIPLWVIINLLTFGNVSRFYKYLLPREQNEVARRFLIKPHYLNNFLNNVTLARNICAHGERFFSLKFTTEINMLPEHSALNIPFEKEKPIMGVKDMFSVLLIVKYLLRDPKMFDTLKEEIARSLTELERNLVSIPQQEVMHLMGFPENWHLV
jgi:abortive infection bacteriophage resistance protein